MNPMADLDKEIADMDAALPVKKTPPPATPPAAKKQAAPPAALEPKVEAPPAAPEPKAEEPVAFDLDALLGEPNPAPKADAPPPSDRENNLGYLRKSSEAAKEEARKAKAEADEARKEAEKYRAELSKFDIAFDPTFNEQYEKPLADLENKARKLGEYAGLKPEQIDRIVKQGLALPRSELKDMLKSFDADSDTVSSILSLGLDRTMLAQRRVDALTNHEATASQLRQTRMAQQAQRVEQFSHVRTEATKIGVRAVVTNDTTGFFKPTTQEEAVEVSNLIKTLPTVLDPMAGEDAAQHHARQVGVLTKGIAFDALAARTAKLQAKYNALVQGVKSRGWANVEADTVSPKKDAPRTRAEILADDPDKDMKNFLAEKVRNR